MSIFRKICCCFDYLLNKQNKIKNKKEILLDELYDFDEDSSFDNDNIHNKKTHYSSSSNSELNEINEVNTEIEHFSLNQKNIFEEKFIRLDEKNIIFSKEKIIEISNLYINNQTDFKIIYNKDSLTLSVNDKGSYVSTSFPIVKMHFKIPKNLYTKKNINKEDFIKAIRIPEERIKWDSSIKDYIIIEQKNNFNIIHTILKSPGFFISERDTIEKKIEFTYTNNDNIEEYICFSSSIDDEHFPAIEKIQRIENLFSIYRITEDSENIIIDSLDQMDYKMMVPSSLMCLTLPTVINNWYKNMRNYINNKSFE